MLVAESVTAIGFAVLHVLGGRLHFLDRAPRRGLLSAAGGVSVAYVFVHLLHRAGPPKKELPEQPESRLGPFVAGSGAYAALLLLV